MAEKCVHKGCGKLFSDPEEPCIYHPGPPVFHEGQKGWQCCKPRVLTFDEFLAIPPCTTGKHSTVDDTPAPATTKPAVPPPEPATSLPAAPRLPTVAAPTPGTSSRAATPQPESESDEPDASIPAGAECRRKGCSAKFNGDETRQGEVCTHHPGAPVFHEGSKGYTCCKRRVLEFDEFMRIEGCKEKPRHLFVGKPKKEGSGGDAGGKEKVESIRHDFYQTPAKVHASLFLKKIVPPPTSTIKLTPDALELDLHTSDNKRYTETVTLFGAIDPVASTFKVMGTKLELELAKADGRGWPVLRADDPQSGEIIQSGRAGRV